MLLNHVMIREGIRLFGLSSQPTTIATHRKSKYVATAANSDGSGV
jgi:hypothetical protein